MTTAFVFVCLIVGSLIFLGFTVYDKGTSDGYKKGVEAGIEQYKTKHKEKKVNFMKAANELESVETEILS